MNRPFDLWFATPGEPAPAQAVFTALRQAGHRVIADVFVADAAEERRRLVRWRPVLEDEAAAGPARYGVRLSAEAACSPDAGFLSSEAMGLLILVGQADSDAVRRVMAPLSRRGCRLGWEFTPDQVCPLDAELLDVVIVRGRENTAGNDAPSVRTLFDLARRRFPERPLWVTGVDDPAAAAVFLELGAAGHVLERHEALSDARPRADASFRQAVNSVLGRLARTTPGELTAMEDDRFLVQGPMGGISVAPPFAKTVLEAGFFPVLALTGLDEPTVMEVGAATGAVLAGGTFGIGLAGPTELAADRLGAAFAGARPSVLVLAADQWPARNEWKAVADERWLHVQTPDMLDASVAEGDRHFILEGSESGGHIGPFTAVQLWSRMLGHIQRQGLNGPDMHCVLAGGVYSAESLLFGMLLAAAFEFKGTLSFQLGTPLLASREAVAGGAIHARYQAVLLARDTTRGVGPGGGLRCAGDAPAVQGGAGDAVAWYSAYRAAIKGGEGLVLAGESVAHFSRAISLTSFAAELRAYRDRWAAHRAQSILVDTLDFRVTGAPPSTDLAVVGMGGLFPGGMNVEQFWNALRNNRRAIIEVPPEHWGPGEYRARDEQDERTPYEKSYTWHAGMIPDFSFDRFDCLKYSIAPTSVESTDRIHLMILKAAGEALESAGADFHVPRRDTVVLIGNSMGGERAKLQALRVHLPDVLAMLEAIPEYGRLDPEARQALETGLREQIFARLPATTEDTLVGLAASTLAGRIASYLDVRGGNFAVDAACAASLAGLSAAVEMLNSGTCPCAVVGGVDSDLSIGTFINFCRLHALAHGISRPFMEDSDGFTMGEGAGVIFLKPFDRAVEEGDRIFARIVGVGLSSDGRVGSLTMPSSEGQVLALQRAFARSGFAPETVGLVEAHGTGTTVGDAAELVTLQSVFKEVAPGRIVLGSVKAHVGHLKSAAGMAALIKVIMALREKTLPPALIEGRPRAELRDPGSPFRLPPAAEPWPRDGFLPRRAAVSAFGFGGSNVHVHLEEMDERLRRLTRSRLLLFSGRDRDEVAARVHALDQAVLAEGLVDLSAPRQAACLGGTGPCRLAACGSIDQPWAELRSRLDAALAGADPASDVFFTARADRRRLAFLYPGQGSALQAPFPRIIESVAGFRYDMERFSRRMDVDLVGRLWPADPACLADKTRWADVLLQPATTALELAWTALLRRLGVLPDAVAGHSLGFYAALVAAGSLSEADALELVRRRAECFGSLAPDAAGGMLALRADEAAVAALQARAPVTIYPANFNSPSQTVIAMHRKDVESMARFLDEHDVEYQTLPVAWGFHSPLMASAATAFARHLKRVSFRRPVRDLYSETLAERVDPASFDGRCPEWLPEHIIRPVRFAAMLEALHADGVAATVEVGARGSLTRFAREVVAGGLPPVQCHTLDSTDPDAMAHLHTVLAALYVEAGVPVDMGAYLDEFAGQLKAVRLCGAQPVAPRSGPGMGEAMQDDAGSAAPVSGPAVDESDAVYGRIKTIIAGKSGFDPEQLQADQLIQETLGVDSLKMVEIGLEIERSFGINFQAALFPRSLSIGGLARWVTEQLDNAAPEREKPVARRYVLESQCVPDPSPPGEALRVIGCLTNDADLARCWERRGYGPARCVEEGTDQALHAAIDGLLTADRPVAGLLYAAVETAFRGGDDLWREVFYPVYLLAHDVLPGLAARADAGSVPFGMQTAWIGSSPGAPGDGLMGFSRSLQLEFPEVRCGHVTVRSAVADESVVDTLWREVSAGDDPFAFVTCRGERREVETLRLAERDAGQGVSLTAEDVVLVTGGGRGITAEAVIGLSADVAPHWILVGSTDPEDRSTGAEEVERTCSRLRALGCRVDYVQCDLARPEPVRRLAEELHARDWRVTGVLHGAGIIADAGIATKGFDDFLRVLTVKAGAAGMLGAVLDRSRLRFWINFSSIASYTGSPGQTDYAAANAVLNAQAEALRREMHAVSILWGPWTGIGMAAGEALQKAFAARGIPVIAPEEGLRFLDAELRQGRHAAVALCGEPLAMTVPCAVEDGGPWLERSVSGCRVKMTSAVLDAEEPFLRDHRVAGIPVLPGVMALELAAAALGPRPTPLRWESVAFRRMIRPVNGRVRLVVNWDANGTDSVAFEGGDAEGEGEAAFSGCVHWNAAPRAWTAPGSMGSILRAYRREELYGEGALLFSGPLFQVLGTGSERPAVMVHERGARAALGNPDAAVYRDAAWHARIPVAALDGLFQLAALYGLARDEGARLPVGVEALWWSGDPVGAAPGLEACVWPHATGEEGLFDAVLLRDGKEVCTVHGLRMQGVEAGG